MTRVQKIMSALGIEGRAVGDEFLARCPYHDDHDPSWSIRWRGTKAGLHSCFACGSGGTIVDLVVHVRKVTYGGAMRWIESVAGGEATGPAQMPPMRLVHRTLGAKLFRLPPEVTIEPIVDWPTPPREYAVERGLTREQVERWGIGYAVSGRLQGRLVLVVRDRRGIARSYMARDYAGEGKRYLYPRENERPDLDVVFGEQHWPASGRRTVVVTEGALDALAAERAGALCVAAMGGSHVRPMHAVKVSTFREVVLLTDPDKAGDRAAEDMRAMLGRTVLVRRVRLPEGLDANSMHENDLRGLLGAA